MTMRTLFDFYRCPHRSVRIVRTRFSTYGDEYERPQVRQQCEDCGRVFGSVLKNSVATADTPELTREDAGRWKRHERELQAELDRESAERAEQRRIDYNTYLQTPEWAARRNLVLQRAGGVCEGCRQAAAEQIHHHTYKHLGSEFLWELAAVCRDCHERFHGILNNVF